MKREIRDIRYDTALQIEAHLFHGKIQPFPNHFHDYYVIGIVEEGNRRLICRSCRYEIEKGDILFLFPETVTPAQPVPVCCTAAV